MVRRRFRPDALLRRFVDDCVHWHRIAKAGLRSLRRRRYPRYKKWCDEYFYLKHRNEPRGIGGLFFDDLNEPGFEQAFAFMRSVGDHYLPAYLPIVERRKNTPTASAKREFQSTGAAATSSSTWSTIAARCSACSRAGAPNRS